MIHVLSTLPLFRPKFRGIVFGFVMLGSAEKKKYYANQPKLRWSFLAQFLRYDEL